MPLVWWLVRAVAGCCTGSSAFVCCLASLKTRGYIWRQWLVSKPSRLLPIMGVLLWSSSHNVAARIFCGCKMLASGDWVCTQVCRVVMHSGAGNQMPFRASVFQLLKSWNVLNERQRPAGLQIAHCQYWFVYLRPKKMPAWSDPGERDRFLAVFVLKSS